MAADPHGVKDLLGVIAGAGGGTVLTLLFAALRGLFSGASADAKDLRSGFKDLTAEQRADLEGARRERDQYKRQVDALLTDRLNLRGAIHALQLRAGDTLTVWPPDRDPA